VVLPVRQVKRPGFTLIELLVVIAIISILASMWMPTFSRAREKARQTSCLSNITQITYAHMMYVSDNDEFLPNFVYGTTSRPILWTEFLYPYTRNRQIYRCPSATSLGQSIVSDYGLGTWRAGNGSQSSPHLRFPGNMSLAGVQRESETIMITDGVTEGPPNIRSDLLYIRHNSGLNIGFADGHVKWMRRESAQKVTNVGGFYFYYYMAADR